MVDPDPDPDPVGECVNVTTCPLVSSVICSPVNGTVTTDSQITFLKYSKSQEYLTYTPRYNNTEEVNPFLKGFQIAMRWRGFTYDTSIFTIDFMRVTSSDGGLSTTSTRFATKF